MADESSASKKRKAPTVSVGSRDVSDAESSDRSPPRRASRSGGGGANHASSSSDANIRLIQQDLKDVAKRVRKLEEGDAKTQNEVRIRKWATENKAYLAMALKDLETLISVMDGTSFLGSSS